MDIQLPHSLLTQFLDTPADPQTIAEKLSLCGPTIDRVQKIDDDWLYQIEIITNRIDTASAFGIAREASVILPQFDISAKLKNNPYHNSPEDLPDLPSNKPVKVQIMDSSLVPRFTAIALKNVQVKDSPPQIQQQLELSGQRPLNNLIDISNELTLKYAQPVHIFDLDKIKDQTMIIRTSKKGETITTLDKKKLKLKGNDIVIEDGQGRLIDLCGIMGAQCSRVDKNTQNILLFVQNYDPQHIRRTSLYTQHRTLAAQIFEKQPDPQLVMPVLINGVKLIQKRAKGEISSNILDIYPDPLEEKEVKINFSWLNQFVGQEIKPAQVRQILERLGFTVKGKKTLTCQVPSYRYHDINIKEDLAEEITRIYGYFRLPSHLPRTKPALQEADSLLKHESQAKQILTHLGFTEIYNPSLVSRQLFQQAGLELETDFKLDNPLSQDHQFMRTSLIPSLLQNLADNRGKVDPPLRIFELSNIYRPQKGQDLADERSTLALATQDLDFFTIKDYLQALAQYLKIDLSFQPLNKRHSPFIQQQTARVLSQEQPLGFLGIVKPQITHRFQLKDQVVISQLDFQLLSQNINPLHHFQPPPQTPPVIEDLTIKSDLSAGKLIEKLLSHQLITKVDYLTDYQGNYTFRLYFNAPRENLTQKKVNQIKSQLKKSLT